MDRMLAGVRDALVTAGLIARQSVVSLRYNWGIAILALVLATSLWVYVTDQENPERTVRVPGTVPIEAVNVPPDQAVFPPLDQSVTVRVRAPENLIDGLEPEDFHATIDLADVAAQEVTVAVRVEADNPRVEVVDVQPSQVVVNLENVTSRSVPVEPNLVGAPPRGFEAGVPVIEPAEVVITGAETLVERVDAVEADVNLTGARTDFQERLLLQARDNLGGNIEGVRIEPESALIRVEITQLEFSGPFIVRPEISGSPATGSNVTSVSVEPAIIIVSGAAEVFQNIDPVAGIPTEPVSIEGATTDVVRPVALRLPPGATTDQPIVTVRVTIAVAQETRTYDVPLEATNVPAGLAADLEQATVEVVLRGSLPDLNAIAAEDLDATVDLTDQEVGEIDLPVQVQAPAGTTVVSVTPPSIAVTVREQ
jgi:YbbR domain-containing protein